MGDHTVEQHRTKQTIRYSLSVATIRYLCKLQSEQCATPKGHDRWSALTKQEMRVVLTAVHVLVLTAECDIDRPEHLSVADFVRLYRDRRPVIFRKASLDESFVDPAKWSRTSLARRYNDSALQLGTPLSLSANGMSEVSSTLGGYL